MIKNIIITGICLFSTQLFGQKVPASVQKAFEQKFPGIKNVSWEKEHKSYEAEFVLNGEKISAEFDPNGIWLQTEKEISITELPAAVQTAVKNQFPAYKLKEVESVENQKGKCYQVELLNGKEEVKAQFSVDGKLLTQEKGKHKHEKHDD